MPRLRRPVSDPQQFASNIMERALNLLMAFSSVFWIAVLVTSACFSIAAARRDERIIRNLGINYGQVGNNLPSTQQAVALVQSTAIRKVKMFDANPAVLRALAGSGIKVTISLPNEQIYAFGRRRILAYRWVRRSVLPFMQDGTRITSICVGNEVLIDVPRSGVQTADQLVPAMLNVHAALVHYRLHRRTKISTPHALNVLNVSYPPSNGKFRSDLMGYLRPMLRFLNHTSTPFMINAFPYLAYRDDGGININLDYARFGTKSPVVQDDNTGLLYTNMLDAMVDSVYAALHEAGFPGVRVAVTETGWPSSGAEAATIASAALYNSGVVKRLVSGRGTPLRPHIPLEAFIFALFDENEKPGPLTEHYFGIFRANMSMSYDLGLELKTR